MSRPQVLLSWSSGKDSAWALHQLRQRNEVDVVGLLTTINEAVDRVAMHAVRRELVEAQARSVGLPLEVVPLPFPCSNEIYEARMREAIGSAVAAGRTHLAFGDLHLQDVRDYRVRLLDGTGLKPLFPIWSTANDMPGLARTMQAGGLRAILTCVDPHQLSERFLGHDFDQAFLAAIPPTVDPCGERGEFHTFCTDAPGFAHPVAVIRGEQVNRDGFWFADLQMAAV